MSRLFRSILSVCALGALCVAQAGTTANNLVIVIANGPLAGTFKANPSNVFCLHARKQRVYSSAFKDYAAKDPGSLAEAGVEVVNPDASGEKRANIRVTFGDLNNKPTVYAIDAVSAVFNIANGTISAEGKTQSGIGVKVTAACANVTEF